MVGQHVGFTEAVRLGEAPAGMYSPVPFTPQAWRTSANALIGAFADADLDTRVLAVELDPVRRLPISFLVSAQFLDTVVHTWDVAAALGELFTPPAAVADSVLRLAMAIPDDDRRDRAHAAFAHALAAKGTPWEQVLALLGREPRGLRPAVIEPGYKS